MAKSKTAAKSKPAAKSVPKSKIAKRVESAAPIAEPTVTTVADVPAAVVAAPASKARRFAKAEGAVEQNGVKRPAADSLCGRVFQVLDDLRAAGADPTAKNAAAAFDGVAIAAATIRTQTQRWREFNGIKREAKAPARKSKAAPKATAPAVVSEEVQQQAA